MKKEEEIVDGHVHLTGGIKETYRVLKEHNVTQVVLMTRNWVWRKQDAEKIRSEFKGISVHFGSEFYLRVGERLITLIGLDYKLGDTELNRYSGLGNSFYMSRLRRRADTYLKSLNDLGYSISPKYYRKRDDILSARIMEPTDSHVELIELCVRTDPSLALEVIQALYLSGKLESPDMTGLRKYVSRSSPNPDELTSSYLMPCVKKCLFRHYFGAGKELCQGLPKEYELERLIESIQKSEGRALLSIEKPEDFKDISPIELGLDGISLSMTEAGGFNRHPESRERLVNPGSLINQFDFVVVGSDYQGLNRPVGIPVGAIRGKVRTSFARLVN